MKGIKKGIKKYGECLKVNAKSFVNDKTILGNNVSFNGMEINGGGKLSLEIIFTLGKGVL